MTGVGMANAVCVASYVYLKWLCREDGGLVAQRTVPSSELLAQPRIQQVRVRGKFLKRGREKGYGTSED